MPNFRPSQNEYNNMTPFKTWLKYQINTWGLNSFPFVESDFDDLTNYAMMMKLMKHFNVLIENQNMVEEDMTALYNAFTELQTYLFDEFADYKNEVDGEIEQFENSITTDFNNLQNYVDNFFDNNFPQMISDKLDEMAQDGTLENLLNDAAHLTKSYNTYTEMMADSATFTNGLRLKTLGYYTINDGGASDYYVNNAVISSNHQIDLQNGLYLNLIKKDNMNPVQFGCYGDGTHDDTTNLQTAITYCESNNIKLVSSGDKIYKITTTLNVDTLICDFNDDVITSDNNINLITINSTNYYGELRHIKFDCTNANSGIYITNGRKKTFNNLIFDNISTYGFYYNSGYEILLSDSHFKANGTSGTIGIYANSSDSKFENIIMIDCQTAIVNNGLNFYNFIHAWILTSTIVENSIFADLIGNRSYWNQCYSDTYGITFKCHSSSTTFVANQLEVFLNQGVWLETMSKPYVVYFVDTASKSIFNQLTNSRINGVRQNQHINLSNEDISMIQLANNNKVWVDKYVGIRGELTGFSSNVTNVIKNEIDYQDGIVTLTLWAEVQVNPNDTRNITTAIMPEYFQPEVPYNGNCINCADVYQTGQNSYVYISTNLQATLNWIDGATTRYIKINATYKSKQFANI